MKMYPTDKQKEALQRYIVEGGNFSIYGKDGIYEELENRISERYSQNPYCLLTNTGTSALSSAYFGVGIKRGDEVIVPTYTFVSTVTPLVRLGAIPVFADAYPTDGLINPASIKECITDKTTAVVVTHMWGLPCNMIIIKEICDEHGLKLVEDVSHAHFTLYQGRYLGEFGDAAAMSVGAKKMVSGGEGGFMITKDKDVYMKATLLGHFNMRAEQTMEELEIDYKGHEGGYGENYRMHPYSAVMINEFIKNEMDGFREKRFEVLLFLENMIDAMSGICSQTAYSGLQYGFKPKYLGENLDNFIQSVNEKMGVKAVKKLDTLPLHDEKLFQDTCKRPVSYDGAKEYMQGRFSIRNGIILKMMEDDTLAAKLISAIKHSI